MTQPNQSELFELCKEVYERTGWEGVETYAIQNDDATWIVGDENGDLFILTKEVEAQGYYDYYAPLYTSDYLLEKLLPVCYSIQIYRRKTGLIDLMWSPQKPMYDDVVSDTPLKALLKLTIALSEAGELK